MDERCEEKFLDLPFGLAMTYVTSCRTNTGKECLNYKCAHLARDGGIKNSFARGSIQEKLV